MNSDIPLPRPGRYRDQLGRLMVNHPATDGAWQAVEPQTKTGRYAKRIASHRFRQGNAEWDGALDGKAMRELIQIGIKESLIVLGKGGRAADVSRFLDELRPFQLDVVLEGAEEIRALIAQAGSNRQFFEISESWPGGVWSDARANKMLTDRLLGHVPPPPPSARNGGSLVPDPTFDRPPVIAPPRRPGIEQVIDRYADQLMAIAGVAGIGQGKSRSGKDIIVVYTTVPVDQVIVPPRLSGYVVKKEYLGVVVPQDGQGARLKG